MPRVTTRQIKAARALLDWSQAGLAQASGLSVPTIKRIESGDGELGGRAGTVDRIVSALAGAGVTFVAEAGFVGVKLRQPGAPEVISLENLNASNDE